ncbi:TadE-like protein [Sporobacter termitidis DSM 10068]|uniref:TadE-like protein n=1 Tax=Sporobacter termitidis DSM 10068 TaxID=1123282 RepID=A0A1M5Z3S1_9FIRM|nr:TadE/TadG family type IV pilus assembly protein [Sporobacter termitidis]SHI18926.1 TadE-like protein [Sporobacter termitidis DSM 10068]
MLKRKLKKLQRDETGQSLVELALILPLLIMLLTVPVDYFRYINTKTILSSAASESIGQLSYASIDSGSADSDIRETARDCYKDRLDSNKIGVDFTHGRLENVEYPYYVYSSDRQDPDNYWNQFDPRDSNYQTMEVHLQLSYELTPITFWGVMFLGDSINVQTPVYTRSVYAGGYKPSA